MPLQIVLTGDINLTGVSNPAVPLRGLAEEFRSADVVYSNLECCLRDPPRSGSADSESPNAGFYAAAQPAGEALKLGGIQAVGIANNVNYGERTIAASIARLDELGIAHTGAGANLEAARAPVILKRNGLRIGFLQRTAVYWSVNHEAGKFTPGVAAIRCHTGYHLPVHKISNKFPPLNRPGVPPAVLTWVDAQYLKRFKEDVAALRAKTDFIVASLHWGLEKDVLQYMPELAHTAIDAGADVVLGHGPHYVLPIEVYKGKPIFYGMGNLHFPGSKHAKRVGTIARLTLKGKTINSASVQFVRQNARKETVLSSIKKEKVALEDIQDRSVPLGTKLTPKGDQLLIKLKG